MNYRERDIYHWPRLYGETSSYFDYNNEMVSDYNCMGRLEIFADSVRRVISMMSVFTLNKSPWTWHPAVMMMMITASHSETSSTTIISRHPIQPWNDWVGSPILQKCLQKYRNIKLACCCADNPSFSSL